MVPDEPATVRADARPAPRCAGPPTARWVLARAEVMRRVSVNIGTIQGGVKINMLPAECVLEVDFRLPVGITRAAVLAKVAAIVARLSRRERRGAAARRPGIDLSPIRRTR